MGRELERLDASLDGELVYFVPVVPPTTNSVRKAVRADLDGLESSVKIK